MKTSYEEALRIHRKYGSSDRVIRHCKTVAVVTMVLGEEYLLRGVRLDLDSAYSAALLHDIGRNVTQTVRHGVEGAELLRSEGMGPTVVEIVRKHVGAGISDQEAKALGFPDLDCVPKSAEEVIVCFADKMVDADSVRPFEEEVKRFQRKGHDVERLRALRARIEADLGEDPEALILDKVKESQ
ncbi:MAG: HDIG domain-containing protein [Thaumarchaeota archaeon]|nr:HDIG domain-containing protein [Nitrososphaerota archaeon]